MSSLLGKIKAFFRKNQNKKVYFLVGFFVFIGLFLLVQPTSAEEFLGIDFRAGLVGAVTDILLGISSWFIKVTVWISQIFIIIASYNNFINSKAVILGWVLVRDIVNMFFVIILLAIAFGTVLGLEQYEWKKLLVKLVFAAVLINFSRVICGVIIDAAQVFMMTFVNGFSATAGGNVINGLNLNKIYNLSSNADPQTYTNNVDLLVTGVAAVFFGAISMFVLGAYLAVILFRVVSLWVLIILSPIAFMSSVLPATQKYASEWWKEFNNNVLAGPLLAFFFWLSFAVVGGGSSVQEVLPKEAEKKYESEALLSSTATGAAAAMDWGAMASFAVAIALLITGVKKTQELGVQGAGMLSSALSTAKKVAMTASGIRAAGWIAGKTAKGVSRTAQLTGLEMLNRSYEKGGVLSKITNLATAPSKWVSGQEKKIELNKALLDSRIGTKWSFQTKKDIEQLKFAVSVEEEKKTAGMQAILHEVEQNYSKTPYGEKTLEELHGKKREADDYAQIRAGTKLQQEEDSRIAAKNKDEAEMEQIKTREFTKATALEQEYNKLVDAGNLADADKKMDEYIQEQSEAEKRYEEALKKLEMKNGGGKPAQLSEYGRRKLARQFAVKKEQIEIDRQQDGFNQKAAAYEEAGDPTRAQMMRSAANNLAIKRDLELYSGMDYTTRMTLEKQMVAEIIKTRKAMEGLQGGSEEYKNLENALSRILKSKQALHSYNHGADGESSRDAATNSLNRIGWFDKEGTINMQNRFRAALSEQLGRVVEAGKEDEAIAEFESLFKDATGKVDEGKLQAALSKLATNYKSAAMNGDFNKFGLISETTDINGNLRYGWNKTPNNDISESGYGYFQGKNKVDKFSTFGNINKDGVMQGISKEGIEMVKREFKGKTATNLNHKDMRTKFASLNEAIVDATNIQEYVDMIKEIKSTLDSNAHDAFDQNIDVLRGKITKAGGVLP